MGVKPTNSVLLDIVWPSLDYFFLSTKIISWDWLSTFLILSLGKKRVNCKNVHHAEKQVVELFATRYHLFGLL